MPSHNRNKRNRNNNSSNNNNNNNNNNKGQDDDRLLATRAAADDSLYNDSYLRRQGDNYRPSAAHRSHYDTERDASSSRGHANSWRSADANDRYEYPPSDAYLRNGRDEYEMVDSRETEGWTGRGNNEGRYEQSGEDWARHYEPSYPSSSYAELPPPTWRSSSSYNDRSGSYTAWGSDGRVQPRTTAEERYVERDSSSWRRDDRNQGGGQKWKSDNGWETRRENRGQTWREDNHKDNPIDPPSEDRNWEPAPGWRPPDRRDAQNQNQNQSQNHNNNTKNGHRNHRAKGKKGKKNHDQSQHQKRERERDWRHDDGDFNNWQRRDVHTNRTNNKSPKRNARKRYAHSPSRSRSRSPPESYSSRRYSRSRSRSPSPAHSTKRRRPDPSPPVCSPPSRTPSERGRANWKQRHVRRTSRSTSRRSLDSRRPRGRSLSSASSITRSSRSPSPVEHHKAVHRLPQASTVSISPYLGSSSGNRDSPKKTKNRTNGKSRNNAEGSSRHAPPTFPPSGSDEMPPPSTIPSQHTHLAPVPETAPPVSITTEQKPEMSSPKTSRPKNAGFKPIVQASSALKRFFPADDDEEVVPKMVQPQTTHWIPEPSAQSPLRKETSLLSEQPIRSQPPKPALPRLPARPPTPETYNAPSQPPPQEDEAINPTVEDVVRSAKASENDDICQVDKTDIHDVEAVEYAPSDKELYVIVSQVGEGTFGKVYKARNTVTKVFVALKRIRMETERDGFPVTAMREIKLLQSLKHDNVVRLYEMMVSNGSVYMVFEYMDHDLTGVLSQTQFSFSDAHLKSLCRQMLAGLAYLHHKGVIHRDIKGSNILLNNRGELKLGDFGLARFYHKRRRVDYTNRVITLWYRPPELLFGATVYGPEVDMWSAGCIMLELFTKKPVFQGNDEIHQLDVIYRIFGTPDTDRWRGVMDLPWYELIKPKETIPNHFRELFKKWMSPAALDLAERLLAYDPTERATATQAMDAPYFTEEQPSAALPVGLATLEGEWHELETKRERARKRRKTETMVQ